MQDWAFWMFCEQKLGQVEKGVRKTVLETQVSVLCIHGMYAASRTEKNQQCNREIEISLLEILENKYIVLSFSGSIL